MCNFLPIYIINKDLRIKKWKLTNENEKVFTKNLTEIEMQNMYGNINDKCKRIEIVHQMISKHIGEQKKCKRQCQRKKISERED